MDKICRQCSIKKASSEFHRHAGSRDGLQYSCKVCQLQNNREYYKSNPDKRWYRQHPEDSSARGRKYKENNWEKMMWVTAKHNARKMGREFEIDVSDIIIPEYCPLLNIKLTRILDSGRSPSNPSIDRIDNSKGYLKDNIMVISDKANRIKMNLSIEELKLLANNINKLYDKL